MIVARQPDGRTLLDREALSALLGRTPETIARHCTPEPCGRYDAQRAERELTGVPDVVPVTAREAHRYLGIPAGTVRSWASRERLAAVGERGRQALYDAADLAALHARHGLDKRTLASA